MKRGERYSPHGCVVSRRNLLREPLRAALLAAAILSSPTVAPAQPSRVVSLNLCEDQLALLVAGPEGLISVSPHARRPDSSNLAEAAKDVPVNYGGAEEVFLLRPDLVLAGAFNDPATLAMLRRLGVRVETFPPIAALDEIAPRLRRLGVLLGREARAEALAAAFERALAAARAAPSGREAAFHDPNAFTAGAGTLEDDLLAAAGLENAARRLGLENVARLPLETLVMARPLLVRPTPGRDERGRAYEALDHPALEAVAAEAGAVRLPERLRVCGGPWVIDAVKALAAAASRPVSP